MTTIAAAASVRRFRGDAASAPALVSAKAGRTVAVCIPARDEAATIAAVTGTVDQLREVGLVDEVVVVDDGSTDDTAARAAAAGATVVVPNRLGVGKGQALRSAVASTAADLLVFLDADVQNFSAWFVTGLVAPLLLEPGVHLVKAAYRRPLHGRPDEGGRVTELVARPLLDRFCPELATLRQPLAGESALWRSDLHDIALAPGYGVEVGLLIDVHRRWGAGAIAEVDLGVRVHRNRPLPELRAHAAAVIDAVLARAPSPLARG